jgi:uncharacterized membrane protein
MICINFSPHNSGMNKFDFPVKKDNMRFILIGLAINILGFILMIGGGSDDPKKFDGAELFSHMRITVAPILVTIGYAVIFYGIMKKPSGTKTEE